MSKTREIEVHFSPALLREIEENPMFAQKMRELSANFRQAAHAYTQGQYPSFDAALAAITGRTVIEIDIDDITPEEE